MKTKTVTIRNFPVSVWNQILSKAKADGLNVADYLAKIARAEVDTRLDDHYRCAMCNELHEDEEEEYWHKYDSQTPMRVCKECKFCLLLGGARTIKGYKKAKGL